MEQTQETNAIAVDHKTAAEMGKWELIPARFHNLPVHVALLPSGKVLALGGSCNDENQLGTPYPSEIWDPVSGDTSIIEQTLAGDLFCVGHCHLADGRLLAAGGTYKYDGDLFGLPIPPFSGLEHAYTFDPDSETWTRVADMAHGRWYPTLVTLGDGRVLAMAGLTKHFPWAFLRSIEVYTPGQGWRKLEGADRWLPLYPRLHLLPSGEVFYAGSFNTHYTYPFRIKRFPTGLLNLETRRWRTIGLPNMPQREEGATVLLPLTPPDYRARVLLAGGGTTTGEFAVGDAEMIDLSISDPVWEQVQAMKHARYYAYAVLLPDGNVLVTGGRSGRKKHAPPKDDHEHEPGRALAEAEIPRDPNAVHEAELFNPATQQWTTMAPMQLDRLYHSNALLLPDGRVMMAGSNPSRRVDELRIEVYSPPYLFKGPRPQIGAAPSRIGYGERFEIRAPEAEAIDQVVLIRLSSTTHCVNTDQRYVGLAFKAEGPDTISARVPENRNLAPPGYFMLFILRDGIPSLARFVHVT
ncbi:MAG TPA: galactose oxidase-like domain-containing protein [Anaerolineales bacterium]